jgi:hypothetical protein
MTAQGHARTRFRRAIERRNLLGAEASAREMGAVTLGEALDLVCLLRTNLLRSAKARVAWHCGRNSAARNQALTVRHPREPNRLGRPLVDEHSARSVRPVSIDPQSRVGNGLEEMPPTGIEPVHAV